MLRWWSRRWRAQGRSAVLELDACILCKNKMHIVRLLFAASRRNRQFRSEQYRQGEFVSVHEKDGLQNFGHKNALRTHTSRVQRKPRAPPAAMTRQVAPRTARETRLQLGERGVSRPAADNSREMIEYLLVARSPQQHSHNVVKAKTVDIRPLLCLT